MYMYIYIYHIIYIYLYYTYYIYIYVYIYIQYAYNKGHPNVVSWFINPINYFDISTINHTLASRSYQLKAIVKAGPTLYVYIQPVSPATICKEGNTLKVWFLTLNPIKSPLNPIKSALMGFNGDLMGFLNLIPLLWSLSLRGHFCWQSQGWSGLGFNEKSCRQNWITIQFK